jgi:hypothetical protein
MWPWMAGIVEDVLDHPNRDPLLPSAIGRVVDLGQVRAVSEPVAGFQSELRVGPPEQGQTRGRRALVSRGGGRWSLRMGAGRT